MRFLIRIVLVSRSVLMLIKVAWQGVGYATVLVFWELDGRNWSL